MARPSSLAQYVLSLLLVLHIASAAPAQIILNDASKDLKRTLTFDDLPTSPISGAGNLTHYSHLTFSSFILLNTSRASASGLISPEDSNCAASAPNALIASRHANPSLWPRITLPPSATNSASHHLSPFFHFVGFNRKPMNYTPQYTTVFINAYGIVDKEVRTHYSLASTYLREGHQPSFPLNITQYFPTWGKNVNMVEIYAQTPDGTDWDFCIDNVMVEFVERGDDEEEDGMGRDIAPAQMHVSMGIDF